MTRAQPRPAWYPWTYPGLAGQFPYTAVSSDLERLLSLCLRVFSAEAVGAAKNGAQTVDIKHPSSSSLGGTIPWNAPRPLRGSQTDAAPPRTPTGSSLPSTASRTVPVTLLVSLLQASLCSQDPFLTDPPVAKPFSSAHALRGPKLRQIIP